MCALHWQWGEDLLVVLLGAELEVQLQVALADVVPATALLQEVHLTSTGQDTTKPVSDLPSTGQDSVS